MPIFAPIVAVAGSTIVRTVVVRGGQAVIAYVLVTEGAEAAGGAAGQIIAEATPLDEEDIENIENEFKNVGATIINAVGDLGAGIGNATIEVIENAGVALIKGLDKMADYVYERTLAGREPDIIAGFTVTILSIGAAVYLYQSVKNSNDAFKM
tara:strand:+ start:400 stop:858 length:459 start_codon:yes stop_codon:yes gene_type:complete